MEEEYKFILTIHPLEKMSFEEVADIIYNKVGNDSFVYSSHGIIEVEVFRKAETLREAILSVKDALPETLEVESEYLKGFEDGHDDGRIEGYKEGFEEGFDAGYCPGENAGYKKGIEKGQEKAYKEGFEEGYEEGHRYGYDEGYSEGYSDGNEDKD